MTRGLARFVVRIVVIAVVVAIVGVIALVLLDRRARQDDEVRLVEVPFSTPGSDAITAGRIIFIQRDKADDPDLIAHELVHVCQWEEDGIEFLWNYTSEYTRNAVELGDLQGAYVELSFEKEARLRDDIDCDLDRYVVR